MATHTYPVSVRLPPKTALPLGAFCDDAGLSRTEVVVRALDEFLAVHKPRPTAYELAMQALALSKTKIAKEKAAKTAKSSTIDSRDISKLKRTHFRDKRSA